MLDNAFLDSARARFFFLTVLLVLCATTTQAQDNIKVGDTVEFDFLGKKTQGVVQKFTGTGWPVVKFEYRGKPKEQFFPGSRVKVVASGSTSSNAGASATATMREWTDATGKFKIQAKMLSRADGKVELEKADGRVITLPIDKLSTQDQTFLKKLEASDNPFAGGEMRPSRGSRSGSSRSSSPANESGAANGKTTTPVFQNQRTLTSGGWSYKATPGIEQKPSGALIDIGTTFTKHAFHSRVAGMALSANKDVLAIGRTNPFDKESEFVVVDLQSKRASQPARIKLKDAGVFAVSPDGSYVVTRRKGFGTAKGSLDFWRHSNGKAMHAASWTIAGFSDREGFSPGSGKFVSSTQLLTVGRKIALWDVGSGVSAYAIPLPSGSKPAFSPSDMELAIVSGGVVNIVDIATGQSQGSFTAPYKTTSLLAFSQSARFLAGLSTTDSSIWVWDLEANELVQELGGPQVASSMQWVGDKYLLVNGSLIDIELRAAVWKYNGSVVSSKDGRFWHAGKNKVASIQLPHQNLDSQTAQFDPDQLLILKPGSQVAFDFTLPFPPAEQKKIRDTLAASLQANQVTINQSASLRLVAKVAKGKPESMTLSRFGIGRGGTTVNFTPHSGTISLMNNQKTLWTRGRRFGPSSLVSIGRNESAQQAVTRMSQPQASFFYTVKLPKYLAALPSGKPLGTSTINENGVN